MSEAKKVKKVNITRRDFDIREIYTPLSVAKKEIWKRWNDKELRKKVEDFLGGDVPKPLKRRPRAVLSRSIITPNREFFYFLDLAQIIALKPLGLEGIEDKFCTKNYDKTSLGKLSFFDSKQIKNIECKKSVTGIIDMMAFDGKRFCDISTLWGENLVDFHHRMLGFYGAKIETFDDFKWFGYQRKSEKDIRKYYEKFFALFICHGVLFENFIVKRNEKEFTDGVVISSYKKIKKIFGKGPIIIPLLPQEDDDLWYFRSYIKNNVYS